MIIIGLSGKKRSGKNAVADVISLNSIHKVQEFAFADSLKNEVCKACGVTREYLDKNKDNFRLILQGWGTDFKRRLVDDNYWIERLGKSMLKSDANVLVVTDIRFKNEANFIREIGGLVVRVNRPCECGGCVTQDNHPSEVDLDDYKFDYIIQNTGTLKDLTDEVVSYLKTLKLYV